MFAVKLLWKGAECWEESLSLLNIAEEALIKQGKGEISEDGGYFIVRRRFVLLLGIVFCRIYLY